MIDEIYKIVEKYNEPQINADERRYINVTGVGAIHRKVRKERKAAQQDSLCTLGSPRLNAFPAPAHERAPQPAIHLRLSRAGGDKHGGQKDEGNRRSARGV